MKLILYTLCFNEADIIPYIVDYWKNLQSQVDEFKVVVYDNHSTDNSVQLLSQYQWIEIREFESDGHNDFTHQQIKQNCWKESKGRADWCCVCDFDEVLWSNTLQEELEYAEKHRFNVIGMKWYAFCGNVTPDPNAEEFAHQQVKRGYEQYVNHTPQFKHLGKFILFNPNAVDEMIWSVGQHILFKVIPYMNLYVTNKIVTFHFNKGWNEDYFVAKRQRMFKRLSDANKKYGMAVEYGYSEEQMRKEYRKYQEQSIDISTFLLPLHRQT